MAHRLGIDPASPLEPGDPGFVAAEPRRHGGYLLPLVLLGTGIPLLFAAPEADLPTSFRLVYEVTPGGPIQKEGARTSRLTASFEGQKGRLSLAFPEGGRVVEKITDPWRIPEITKLWRRVREANLFGFKAELGAQAPDFGSVRLSLEAVIGGTARATRIEWDRPLRNDGQIWPLVDHLDRLMSSAPAPAASVQPARTGIIRAETTTSTPGAIAMPEMLIALETTRLPLVADDPAGPAGRPVGEREKHREGVMGAIGVLDERLKLRPKDPELLALKAAFLYELGEFERAALEFSRAVRLQPHQADHYNNRGIAYLKLGRKEDAIRDLEEALRRDPSRYSYLVGVISKIRGK